MYIFIPFSFSGICAVLILLSVKNFWATPTAREQKAHGLRTFEQNDGKASLDQRDLLEDVIINQSKTRRSSDGWTCYDLALIIREYDFVLALLERINNFIKETLLSRDDMEEDVKTLVNRSLGIFKEAEIRLESDRYPLVQHQTELGCDSENLTENVSTEAKSISSTTEVLIGVPTSSLTEEGRDHNSTPSLGSTTGGAISVNVTEFARDIVILSIELLTIMNEIDSNTFPRYADLANLLKLLDTLIDTLKRIADIENGSQRSSDVNCKTMVLYAGLHKLWYVLIS